MHMVSMSTCNLATSRELECSCRLLSVLLERLLPEASGTVAATPTPLEDAAGSALALGSVASTVHDLARQHAAAAVAANEVAERHLAARQSALRGSEAASGQHERIQLRQAGPSGVSARGPAPVPRAAGAPGGPRCWGAPGQVRSMVAQPSDSHVLHNRDRHAAKGSRGRVRSG